MVSVQAKETATLTLAAKALVLGVEVCTAALP